jgi:hypothetical protein
MGNYWDDSFGTWGTRGPQFESELPNKRASCCNTTTCSFIYSSFSVMTACNREGNSLRSIVSVVDGKYQDNGTFLLWL